MGDNTIGLRTSEKNGWTLLCVEGRLDRLTAQDAGEKADNVLAATQKLAVDMSGLEYLSSAGIRVLLRLTKQAQAEGKAFALVAPSGMVKVVLAESRMDMFATIYASADELPV
jgi:anti-anti-sigma factor